MPLFTLRVMGIPRDVIVEQTIKLSSFGGNTSFNIGYINLDLILNPYEPHSISCYWCPNFLHLLLERLWTQKHKVVPSMYHHCFKAIWKSKKVHVDAFECPFQKMKLICRAFFFFLISLMKWRSCASPTSRYVCRHRRTLRSKKKNDGFDTRWNSWKKRSC